MNRTTYRCNKWKECEEPCKAHGWKHAQKESCSEICSENPDSKCVLVNNNVKLYNNKGRKK